jgi:hypothetical protein
MRYQKPQIHLISIATKAIESQQQKILLMVVDNITNEFGSTGPAYESDE